MLMYEENFEEETTNFENYETDEDYEDGTLATEENWEDGYDDDMEDYDGQFDDGLFTHPRILLLLATYRKYQKKMDEGRQRKYIIWRSVCSDEKLSTLPKTKMFIFHFYRLLVKWLRKVSLVSLAVFVRLNSRT
jgi:hypothetical protein